MACWQHHCSHIGVVGVTWPRSVSRSGCIELKRVTCVCAWWSRPPTRRALLHKAVLALVYFLVVLVVHVVHIAVALECARVPALRAQAHTPVPAYVVVAGAVAPVIATDSRSGLVQSSKRTYRKLLRHFVVEFLLEEKF